MMMRTRLLPLALVTALGFGACDDAGLQENPFSPEVGHPKSWVSDHGDAALTRGSTCPDCHGTDLRGGASQLSCFTSQYEGVACHETGVGKRHTAGWSLPEEHGKATKGPPGISSGFASCQACHGNGYEGGTSEIPCGSCHGISAPHPAGPWLEGRYSHSDVNEQNAGVCADCHGNLQSTEPPGCSNGSLCHGERKIHPEGWALPEEHGAEAMADIAEGGFDGCRSCHGDDFAGGTSDVSCGSCHGIDAPHPSEGWSQGGEAHRATGEENAPVCADCHEELADPPDCFTANDCHNESTDDEGTVEPEQTPSPPAPESPDSGS